MRVCISSCRISELLCYIGENKEQDKDVGAQFKPLSCKIPDKGAEQIEESEQEDISRNVITCNGAITDRLKREVQKGLPVVLCLHVPLYEKSLYAKQSELSAESVGFLCGVPDAYTNAYPEFRRLQQHTDAATARMIEYIAGETLIRAVLAGHLHYDYTSTLFDRVPQIVTGKSTLRTVEFR